MTAKRKPKKLKPINKSISEMTRKEFDELPHREDRNIGLFDSLVILPRRQIHDSGYRCLDFVAVKMGKPICRLSGCSDVVHINGIGGYGDWNPSGGIPTQIPIAAWSLDCLPKSGLMQLFFSGGQLKAGTASSSFEIFGKNP